MPYIQQWVDPEIVLTHNGITVYHLYKYDDCENNPPSDYNFTVNKHGSYDDDGEESGSYCIEELDTEDRLAKEHPPYMTDGLDGCVSNPAWTDASPERRAEIAREWEKWQEETRPRIVKEILIAAIDSGRIKSWVEE